ncbi:Tn3 family transposase [Streptomyces tropicalis]|uniref:Tn3 family transposase n=1 Tax=Streptomyces tropicalis TaxID=3034234 RepID=UPI0034D986F2
MWGWRCRRWKNLRVPATSSAWAHAICHGGRGQIRQAHLGAAVAHLHAEGHDIKDEDVARISLLKDRHINFLGRYLFNMRTRVTGCAPSRTWMPSRMTPTTEAERLPVPVCKHGQRLSSPWRCWATGSSTDVSLRYRPAVCLSAAVDGECLWAVRRSPRSAKGDRQ